MIKKLILILFFLSLTIVTVGNILLKKYTSEDNKFSFYYPRNWSVTEVVGLHFSGLVISDHVISDNSDDYSNGGFLEINVNDVQTSKTDIQDYINEQKNNNNQLVIPGPSQFEYAGTKTINGFDQVYSNRALSDSIDSKLYWKISDNSLVEVYSKIPNNITKRKYFEFVSNIAIRSLKTNER